MGIEQPKANKSEKESSPKKRKGIFNKIVNVVALGATLVGGKLHAEDSQNSSTTTNPTTESGGKLADAEAVQKIREKLGDQEPKVESDSEPGHIWSSADAKIFQTLREKTFFDGSMEKHIREGIQKERELKEKGLVEKNKLPSNPDQQTTGSSSWARNVVKHAKILQEGVRDQEDVMNLIYKSFGSFVYRFQNPDPVLGDSINEIMREKEKLIEWDRSGTKADFKSISEEANELKEIFQKLTKEHGIHPINIRNEVEMLSEISQKCAERAK